LKSSWVNKEISVREAARRLGVYHKTFLYWMKKSICGEKSTGFSPQLFHQQKSGFYID